MRTLLELIGLDAAERERRLAFLGFTTEDEQRLAAAAPFVETVVDDIIAAFYERVLAEPESARFLQDPALVARLKQAQRRHFLELCRGPWDADFFESRLRVGVAHARIRLAPHLYLGSYLIQIRQLRVHLLEAFGNGADWVEPFLESFGKIIMLDIALATDAYIYGGYVDRGDADARAYEAALAQQALELKTREEERREELLRMVVHDIRSPVAAIIATARAALRRWRDPAEPPGRQFALVEATGQNVLQIIDDMVSHARAPGGELPLHPEPFDVSEVVSACVAQLRPFAQQTAHALHVVALEAAPATALDKVLVRRVVSNLLVNACRHTPAGSTIEVECRLDAAACRVVVRDDGPGLPSDVREALADGAGPRPRRDAGAFVDSGLGLPFCVMACARMGGRLDLEEGPRRGTSLVVSLPAA